MKYSKPFQKKIQEIIQVAGKCAKCGRPDDLNIDHIVPVSFLVSLGLSGNDTYDEENFEVLCRMCNHHKSNRFEFANPKTKILLLKYLERV